ncbi:MAG: methionyl-tRNA formyltransferase [Clostridiales bacterium]|nr:methionyl-tRNA formyltransferase [Clostridiales bacterium]
MGTPDFAVECLDKLHKSEHNVVLAVSQMDKPKGRDMKVVYTPVKEYCVNNNIGILQPEKIRNNTEFIEKIKSINPDIIVVVAYGKILPKEILEIPRLGCINVHGSLLPNYRGAAPIQWSIINGDEVTGITTMYMDEGMDTGDMLLKREVKIEPNDTYGTLYEKLKVVGGEVLIKTIDNIENIKPEKQGEEFTVAPMIEKSLGKIDWNKSAIEIHNLVRGLNPMPGCFFNIEDKMYKVWETEVINENSNKEIGTIIKSNSKEGLFIQTGNGVLSVKIIQAPNSKRMNILDYLRGKTIEENIILK